MKKSLVLMGYMGSGKSVIGKRLAELKSVKYIDLDHYIESNEKISISMMFKQRGELHFRKKERFYLKNLLSKNFPCVISLGGGTPCYFDNVDYIIQKKTLQSLYLKTSPSALASRLFEQREHRPMIAHLNSTMELEEFIAKHLFERIPFYLKAKHHISTDDQPIKDLVIQISKLLT